MAVSSGGGYGIYEVDSPSSPLFSPIARRGAESEAFLEGRAMAVAMADDWVERVRRECPAESGSGGDCESGLSERSCC